MTSEYRKVAFEADRIVEAIFGDTTTLEDVAAKTQWSAEQLREYLRVTTREDCLALFEMALRLDVSPFWLMGYDAPKQQAEYERRLKKMLFAADEAASRPELLEVLLRMSGLSDEVTDTI